MVVVVLVVFAAAVVGFTLVEHFRPGRRTRRSTQAAPFWLHDNGRPDGSGTSHSGGVDLGAGGGVDLGGGGGSGGDGGGSC